MKGKALDQYTDFIEAVSYWEKCKASAAKGKAFNEVMASFRKLKPYEKDLGEEKWSRIKQAVTMIKESESNRKELKTRKLSRRPTKPKRASSDGR